METQWGSAHPELPSMLCATTGGQVPEARALLWWPCSADAWGHQKHLVTGFQSEADSAEAPVYPCACVHEPVSLQGLSGPDPSSVKQGFVISKEWACVWSVLASGARLLLSGG